jgi:antirestriction protein ArdC
VSHGGNKAFYAPSHDAIRLPAPEQFSTLDHYRATLAHEATHATGSKARLDRDLTGRFGGESYAAEELVAELSAAMIGARLGFDTSLIEHHAAYLADWLRVLKNDRKALLTAASKAQQACDYLCPAVVAEEQEEEQKEPALALAA